MTINEYGNLIFSTGREESPNCGIVGIDHSGNCYEGYDSTMGTETMTPAERRELAIMMIDRWKVFWGLELENCR